MTNSPLEQCIVATSHIGNNGELIRAADLELTELRKSRADLQKAKDALISLVGESDLTELRKMKAIVKSMAVTEPDAIPALKGINALLEIL